MAVRNIVIYPDERLRKKAKPIEVFGPELVRLAADMVDTMDAFDGVGLAAPQIGVSRRILVLREPEKEVMCFVNPEILDREGEETGEEGCLSLPQLYAPITRAARVRVRAFDQFGKPFEVEASGLLARIIQHEYDHLEGVVILDRLDVLSREEKSLEWEEIRAHLSATAGAD